LSEATKAARRRRKIRAGQWIRNMTQDEYVGYLAACDLLGLGVRNIDGTVAAPAPTNVTSLFPVGQNVGGIVPEGGDSKPGNTDTRVRGRLKPIRLGKRWSEIMDRIADKEYTWDEFVATLSPEELARGMLRDKHGSFTGRPPSIVPRAFHDACIRELLGRGRILYKENYIAAIEAMTAIAQNPNAKESDRIKAATFVIERLEGKVPDKLEVSAADPWQQIISGIVAQVDDEQVARTQEYLSRRGEDASL